MAACDCTLLQQQCGVRQEDPEASDCRRQQGRNREKEKKKEKKLRRERHGRCVSEPETEQSFRSQQTDDAKGERGGNPMSRELYLQWSSASALRDKKEEIARRARMPRPGT